MKLQLVKRHGGKRRAHRFRRRIDKQPDRAHQRRQQREQSLRLRERYMARRAFIKDKTEGIGAAVNRGFHIVGAGQPADFDSGVHSGGRVRGCLQFV